MKITTQAFLVLLFTIASLTCHSESFTSRTLLTINPTPEATRNSEGDIIQLRDGSLALVYTRFKGGDADHSAADLVIRTSVDPAKTWSDDRIIVPNEGLQNVMSVSLLRLPSDEILLFYLRKDSQGERCNMFVRRSSDELKTVSEPTRVTLLEAYHVVNNARVTRLKSGRIIVPANLHSTFTEDDSTSISTYSSKAVPLVYFSDDDGRTWKRDSTSITGVRKDRPTFQENGVVELTDGRLWMYIRTAQGSIYGCHSNDQGITWSDPEPTPLKSPLSPATVRRVPWSGQLMCVWNDHTGTHPFPPKKRTPLCVTFSKDEGKTWQASQVIESDPDGWYCYTSLTFLDDQAILSYCAGDSVVGRLNRLKVIALSKSWIDEVSN